MSSINIFFIIAILLLFAWNFYLYFQFKKTKENLKIFFSGKKAKDLEEVLFEEINRLKKNEKEIKTLTESLKALEQISANSIQKIGIIRFNPFKDTGGDQSFVIALLDYNNNGLVISSLYTREGTRIYSKPIKSGKSSYQLSKEEEQALQQAQDKSFVSPR